MAQRRRGVDGAAVQGKPVRASETAAIEVAAAKAIAAVQEAAAAIEARLCGCCKGSHEGAKLFALRASRSSFRVLLLVLLFSPGGAAAREREVIRASRFAQREARSWEPLKMVRAPRRQGPKSPPRSS